MRAVVVTDFGAKPEVRHLDVPDPGEGELRVRVHAASVNGFDLAVAGGFLKEMMEHRFPVVLGKEERTIGKTPMSRCAYLGQFPLAVR